ncbi:MAG: hypothetical protein ACOX5Q_00110 [Bacillota bacterium]|jgi:hypothetical protein|nr:hypothetical protein [Candidatus Fermentithermobacillaceae bacterium]
MSRKKRERGLYAGIFAFALSAFVLSLLMNLAFERLYEAIPPYFGVPLFLLVIALGIASDAVGLAATRAREESLLSMASRRVPGAREAVWFVRNAPRVSSVFSDLAGDVAATMAGALAVALVYRVGQYIPYIDWAVATSVAVGIASMLSVGGKALFKPVTLKYAESIILILGRIRQRIIRERKG